MTPTARTLGALRTTTSTPSTPITSDGTTTLSKEQRP